MEQPAAAPRVSVIIPAFNKWAFTFKCLVELKRNTDPRLHEVIVIDNASSDETAAALPQLQGVTVRRNEQNLGFAKACNQGARLARGELLVFLNNDTEPLAGWLEPLVAALDQDPAVQMAGARLLYPDGTVQHGGVAFLYGAPAPITPIHVGARGRPEDCAQPLMLNAVTAACMAMRRRDFEAQGGFDEDYLNGYEDVDLCFKVRAGGGLIRYVPQSTLFHHESVSDGRFKHARHNVDRLHRKWLEAFDAFDLDYRAEPPPPPTEGGRPPFSVVVVAHDALDTLAPCLESALAQTRPTDEVVLVDDASDDCTGLLARKLASRAAGRLSVVTNPRRAGWARSIAAAVAKAKHGHVVVLSALVKPGRGFAERLWHHHQRTDGAVRFVGGALDPLPSRTLAEQFGPSHAPVPSAPAAVPVEELASLCVLATRASWHAANLADGDHGAAPFASSAGGLFLAPEVLVTPLVPVARTGVARG